MTKTKKIVLSVIIAFLIVTIIIGGVACYFAFRKNTKAYNIEHKILEKEITTASYIENGNNPYFIIELDLKISLLNTTNKEYVYNTDVLYLEVDGHSSDDDKSSWYVEFSNNESVLCFSDVMGEDIISIIPANNAINSISGSIDLKLKCSNLGIYSYGDYLNMLNTTMPNVKFKLKYNNIEVAEFKPEAKITSISGLKN